MDFCIELIHICWEGGGRGVSGPLKQMWPLEDLDWNCFNSIIPMISLRFWTISELLLGSRVHEALILTDRIETFILKKIILSFVVLYLKQSIKKLLKVHKRGRRSTQTKYTEFLIFFPENVSNSFNASVHHVVGQF